MAYDPYNLEDMQNEPLLPRTDSWGHQEVPSLILVQMHGEKLVMS